MTKWFIASWTISIACFVAGFYVGMNIDAPIGAGLWLTSALFALAPFASHRDHPPRPLREPDSLRERRVDEQRASEESE